MAINLAVAPCSWGVEDAQNKENPPWERVVAEASEAGYAGIELGPFGYLPQDAVLLKGRLDSLGLRLVAGTLYEDLVDPANLQELLRKTHVTCKLLAGIKGRNETAYLVIIDRVKDERNHTAGQSEKALRLEVGEWRAMTSKICRVARVASEEYGIRPVVHPHAGGYIEFDDETERIVQDIPHEKLGLCLDTGHLYYAGGDPSGGLEKYALRLDYIHFKDISRGKYIEAIRNNLGFFSACSMGVMCPIGQGCLDYEGIRRTIEAQNYRGWITVEQERDPRHCAGSLTAIKKSRDFLGSLGFA
jgi:inosose dehydratase